MVLQLVQLHLVQLHTPSIIMMLAILLSLFLPLNLH
jgi:hypothetical protein